jgi:phospholipid transport system substrate-binding protein
MSGFLKRPLHRRAVLGAVAATLAVPWGPAVGAVDPAEDYVRKIADQVMALANSGQKGSGLKARFASLLNSHINLRGIANFALGSYLSKLPPGRKDEFYSLVNNYAASLFVYYVDDFRGSELEILSNAKQGKYTVIQSAIKLKGGGREQVRWRLAKTGSGYRVSDVNLKGVWLTISMKDRFNKVLNKSKGDFDPLFAELREAETW